MDSKVKEGEQEELSKFINKLPCDKWNVTLIFGGGGVCIEK